MHESTACTVLLPGSYVSESNYFENGWQHSYWGSNYPLCGVNPMGWTVVRREIGPGYGRVVSRTARVKDNRAPSAVCGCCTPRR
jgi:hypothetical protein